MPAATGFKPLANPLLIVGDNPALPGGLSRICRDLATLACTMPEFRVGVMGRGWGNSRKLPFTLYPYPESEQWGERLLAGVWKDFAGGRPGVIMTTDDPSRRHWFANSIGLPQDLQQFLGPGRDFQKWGYFPIDGTGPSAHTLPILSRDTIKNYDRVLTASEWGYNVVRQGGRQDADWLPHGIDTSIFRPIQDAREFLDWGDLIICGCVMANQVRKDWPAAFECFGHLKLKYGSKFRAWLHSDSPSRSWDVNSLAAEYGVADCIEYTSDLVDHQLAVRYSGCDVTILPSGGEGFGYPVAESMACGTACVVPDYSGCAELVLPECRVPPLAYRVETFHNFIRAINSGRAFATFCEHQIEMKQQDPEYRSGLMADSISHLSWEKLRFLWERWFREGLR